MTAAGEQFFQNADRISRFHRIVNALFGDTDAALTEGLKHIRFGYTAQPFKLQITNDRQFPHLENDVNTTPRALFGKYSCSSLIEKAERDDRLQIALNLLFVVRIAWTGLNVIKNVVFSKTPVTGYIDRLNQALPLGADRTRDKDS